MRATSTTTAIVHSIQPHPAAAAPVATTTAPPAAAPAVAFDVSAAVLVATVGAGAGV